jgi:hypothetical protein
VSIRAKRVAQKTGENTMKKLIFIAIISTFAFGCSSTAPNPPQTSDAKTAGTPAATESKPSTAGASTPTAAAEKMFAAIKNKDAAALKSQLSAASLKEVEDSAKRAGEPVEKYLGDILGATPVGEKFEARNEKIDGDRATVEMADKNGQWTPNKFVKENGVWKIALV